MPNQFFRFKQFTVQQDRCAMKVCTDACLFGAWATPALYKKDELHFLDIGTGTGLLSLMLVQRYTSAYIDAVEKDAAAASQAKENFEASPWHNNLRVFHCDIQNFDEGKQYDFIICNPPFYEDDLKSPSDKKNAAKHSTQLTIEELIHHINRLLLSDGSFALLVPYSRQKIIEAVALKYQFNIVHKTLAKQTPEHNYFRSMLLFQKQGELLKENEIIIKDMEGGYTFEFVELLKNYYLYL